MQTPDATNCKAVITATFAIVPAKLTAAIAPNSSVNNTAELLAKAFAIISTSGIKPFAMFT